MVDQVEDNYKGIYKRLSWGRNQSALFFEKSSSKEMGMHKYPFKQLRRIKYYSLQDKYF